jgi:hypothetical protein
MTRSSITRSRPRPGSREAFGPGFVTLELTPFRVEVDDAVLADLRDRLTRTRLSNQIDGIGW